MFNIGDRVSPPGFEFQKGVVTWVSEDGSFIQVEWSTGASQIVESRSVVRVK